MLELSMFDEELVTPKPIIRWVGGKTQLLKALKFYMPKSYNTYWEPFIGGGALLFDLLPNKAVISDLNENLINLYKTIKENVDLFEKEYNEIYLREKEEGNTERLYKELRKEYNQLIKTGENVGRASALFVYLNARCFNALYRVNSNGEFNVSFGGERCPLTADLVVFRAVSRYFRESCVEMFTGDFEGILRGTESGDFVFLDPPYLSNDNCKTDEIVKYNSNVFDLECQKRLAQECKRLNSIGVKFMQTNSKCDFIYENYAEFKIRELKVNHYIRPDSNIIESGEVLITNY